MTSDFIRYDNDTHMCLSSVSEHMTKHSLNEPCASATCPHLCPRQLYCIMFNLRKVLLFAGLFGFVQLIVMLYPMFRDNTRDEQHSSTYVVRKFGFINEKHLNSTFPITANKPEAEINCNYKTCNTHIASTKPKEYKYFTGNYLLDKPPMTSWVTKENTWTFCENRITIYSDLFAILRDVTIFPTRINDIETQAKGGEEIRHVLNQQVSKETYVFNSDFFEMNCTTGNDQIEKRKMKMPRLHSLKLNLVKNIATSHPASPKFANKYVIAVVRQDYANLHNWVRNILNTFIIMMHFKIQPSNMSILFMDGHPATELDKAWETIYDKPLRVGQMRETVQSSNFILSFVENEGPLSKYENTQVSYLEEFRSFVLSRFGLESKSTLNCTSLKITIILRRNSVYHPRNVNGNTGRKIFNEAELVDGLMKEFPGACVKAVVMETLPMKLQLDAIRQTDLLIGMHGAGMSHVVFLPKHAAILELFPMGFKIGRPWYKCFHSIANWRNMNYDTWENFDRSMEMPSDFSILPIDVIVNKSMQLANKSCSS